MAIEPDGDHVPQERVPSGISGLDVVLRGGLLRDGLFIVQGEPGAGKTILGNQVCFNHVAAGGRALYLTLLAESHARMLMHIGPLGFFDATVIPSRLAYLSAFGALEKDGLPGLRDLIRREVQARGATLLVLDGFAAVLESSDSARTFKKFINELQTQATLTGCTILLLTTVSSEPTPPEHTMVDGIIELTSRLYGRHAERDLQVRKLRGGSYLRGIHSFDISDRGITVYPRTEAWLTRPAATDGVGGAPVSTGLTQLDSMMGGGLPRHSTTLLVGPTGRARPRSGCISWPPSIRMSPPCISGCTKTRRRSWRRQMPWDSDWMGCAGAAPSSCCGSPPPKASWTRSVSGCSMRSAGAACVGW